MRLRTDIKELHHVAVAFEQAKTPATRRANDKRNSDSGTSSFLPSPPRRRPSRRTLPATVRGTQPQHSHTPNIPRPRGGAMTAPPPGDSAGRGGGKGGGIPVCYGGSLSA